MKTVKEHLLELDSETLINTYINKHPIDWELLADKDIGGVREIKQYIKTVLRDYVKHLKSLEPQYVDGKTPVIFARKTRMNGIIGNEYSLVDLKELKSKGADTVKTYSIFCHKQEEMMGWFVAKTALTQQNIYELLASVMFHGAYWGYEQEHLEKEQKSLEETIMHIELGEEKLYSLEEIETEYGLESEVEVESEEEKVLIQKIYESQLNYDEWSRRTELKQLLKSVT